MGKLLRRAADGGQDFFNATTSAIVVVRNVEIEAYEAVLKRLRKCKTGQWRLSD